MNPDPQPNTKETLAHPQAILIRTPNWLGDLMMSTAFIRAVLEQFPNAAVDLVVRKGFEHLPLPRRGQVLPYDKKTQRPGAFGRHLRERGYSHFFVLPPSLSSAWMAFQSRIPHRIGHPGQGRWFFLRPSIPPQQPPRSVHLLQEYMELLTPWGLQKLSYPAGLEATPQWLQKHLPVILDNLGPYVVLAPGAEYGPAKQWPLSHYQELARRLSLAGHTVVVVGLLKEQAAGEEILHDVRNGLNLCGKTALVELAAVLARAKLLVSNDSGAMHLGAAMGIPQIAIFGSTNPTWTAPLNPKAIIITNNLPCAPCYKRTCPMGHTRCLTEILPHDVMEEAMALLG